MIGLLASLALGLAATLYWRWRVRPEPEAGDWQEYLAAARGLGAPAPFAWRWLWPALCGSSWQRWDRLNRACAAATVPAVYLLALGRGLDPLPALAVCGAWSLAAPFWERTHRVVFLTDAPAVLALVGCVAALDGKQLGLAVALALVAGALREWAPVVAAAAALSPVPFVGLLAVGWWCRRRAPWRHPHLYGSTLDLFRRFGLPRLRAGVAEGWAAAVGPAIVGFVDWRGWLVAGVAFAPALRSVDVVRFLAPALPFLLVGAAGVMAPGLLLVWALVAAQRWEP